MADSKISSLSELTSVADNDELVIVDKSDTSMAATGTNKRVKPTTLASRTETLTNKTIDADNNTISNLKVDNIKAGTLVIESEGIAANDNDTTIPTSAAVKDYVDKSFQYQIVPTVTSNNLTVALKTLAGNDPSALDPINIRIGNTIRTITSALSVTKNAGTNWCNAGSTELATKEIDYFVYLGYNATDGVTLGFSRIPYGALYSDFSATTTNEKYCAISTITNATASDVYTNIGRFAATLSAGAGYTWSVPTFTTANLVNRPIYETRWLLNVGRMFGTGGSLGTYSEDRVISKYIIRNKNCLYVNQRRVLNKGSWSGGVRMATPITGEEPSFFSGVSYAQGGLTLKAIANSISTDSGGTVLFHNNVYIADYNWGSVTNDDIFSVRTEYTI